MMCTWELRQGGPQQVFIVVRVQIFTLQAASELLLVTCGHWRDAKQQNVGQFALTHHSLCLCPVREYYAHVKTFVRAALWKLV